jgi:hypothetical protein
LTLLAAFCENSNLTDEKIKCQTIYKYFTI